MISKFKKRDKKAQWTTGKPKKAQVTVFIIVAIILVLGIALFIVFREGLIKTSVPKELESAYSYYLSCIEGESFNGISILGQQGGYIETPDFSPGNEYMPFSSELDFLGIGVPYWYYISGNNIKKEQVPSKQKMQEQLNDYIKERVDLCDFSQFEEQGYGIIIGESDVNSFIRDNSVDMDVKQDINTIIFQKH